MIRTRMQGDTPFFPNMLNNGSVEVCLKEDVDAVIANLKRENEELKVKLENVQASVYAESVDAGMRERKLQRALYKACANWAACKACILECFCAKIHAKKWEGMFNKCRAKAEQYKETNK